MGTNGIFIGEIGRRLFPGGISILQSLPFGSTLVGARLSIIRRIRQRGKARQGEKLQSQSRAQCQQPFFQLVFLL